MQENKASLIPCANDQGESADKQQTVPFSLNSPHQICLHISLTLGIFLQKQVTALNVVEVANSNTIQAGAYWRSYASLRWVGVGRARVPLPWDPEVYASLGFSAKGPAVRRRKGFAGDASGLNEGGKGS